MPADSLLPPYYRLADSGAYTTAISRSIERIDEDVERMSGLNTW